MVIFTPFEDTQDPRCIMDILAERKRRMDRMADMLLDDDLACQPQRQRVSPSEGSNTQRSFQSALVELELDSEFDSSKIILLDSDSSAGSTTATASTASTLSSIDDESGRGPAPTPDEGGRGPAISSDSNNNGTNVANGTTTVPRCIESEQHTLEAMLDDMIEPGSPVRVGAFQSMPNAARCSVASNISVGKNSSAALTEARLEDRVATVGTSSTAALTTDAQLEDLIDPLLPEPAEWWYSEKFWDKVNLQVGDVRDTDWCILDFFNDAPRSWNEALNAAASYINDNVVDIRHEFKIGITECCRKRWENTRCGWKWENFEVMIVLYAAPSSKPCCRYSTGAFEKALIREFARVNGCLNVRGSGGEGASMGSPHFAYVIVRSKSNCWRAAEGRQGQSHPMDCWKLECGRGPRGSAAEPSSGFPLLSFSYCAK